MGKPKGKYTLYTGEDLYQQCKRRYEGEYSGYDDVDSLCDADALVRAYLGVAAHELDEGLQ